MPPKVHTKFDDDSLEPSGKSDNVPEKTIQEKNRKPDLTSAQVKAPQQTNGVKRARDGSTKHESASKPAQPIQSLKTEHFQRKGWNAAPGSVQMNSFPQGKWDVQNIKSNGANKLSLQRSNSRQLLKTAKELEKARKLLPIWSKKSDIRWALRNNDVLLLNGETGSGKSTQTPQFLHTEPWCKKQTVTIKIENGTDAEVSVGGIIAVTEPRRVAAMTLAGRVAREIGSSLNKAEPGLVGYAVRFDSILPKGMKIKFLTEGMLLQEMIRDPHLRQYSAVIVDEIHERSTDVDLIAGFLRQLIHGDKKGRGGIPLKVVVMSATLDLGGLETFFAKPETQPKYKPGKNHGEILAPHLLEWDSRGVNGASASKESPDDQSRRSSADTFSSWDGINSSDDDKVQLADCKATPNGINTAKPTPGGVECGIPEGDIAENGVAVEYVQGRQYDVKVFYEVTPSPDYLQNMLQTILKLHTTEPLPGDILVFLTGQEEIETLKLQLEHYAGMLVKTVPRMKVMPLYGALPGSAQQEAFEKVKEHFTRKIVLATNIAETSVTVSGVHFVVDCGKSKVKQYRPRLGMESLLSKPISKVSAIQRAGRAGRETAGKCFRIYTPEDFANLESDELPEILRSDVVEAVLKMKACGINDVLDFPLMDSPDIRAMEIALLQLHVMGALDGEGKLTDAGKKMATYPLPAAYGRVIIAAAESGCLLEAIDVISCLTSDTEVFLQPKSEEEQEATETSRAAVRNPRGDILTYLYTMRHYAAENADRNDWCRKRLISVRSMKMAIAIRKQLRQICFKQDLLKELPPSDPQPVEEISSDTAEVLLKTFLKAFATRTAVLGASGYLTTQGHHEILIHPSSVLYGKKVEAIMFLDNVYTAKNYAKKVSVIQANWIVEALEM
jgi:ATP-dependent RNA helicase DHR2